MRFEMLTRQEMDEIHSAAVGFLATSGLKVFSHECRTLFEKKGAEVDNAKRIVRVPPYLVEESLKAIDRRTAHIDYARNPKFDVSLGNGLHASLGEGGTYVVDPDTGQRRLAVLRDVEKFARLSDSLENVSSVVANVVPSDVHPKFRGLYQAKALFENTSKPCIAPMTIGTEQYYYEMAVVVAGGEEELKKRPLVRFSSSLHGLSKLCKAANLGLPVEMDLFWCDDLMPSAGGTAPVTLAGTLLKAVTRFLMHITFAQSIKRGTPMRVGVRATILDMKTGTVSTGSPEMGMLAAAGAQLAKQYYQLPVDSGWAAGDSKVTDEQLGYEKMIVWLLAALAGADEVSGMSLFEAGLSASYGQLVIDNELIGEVKRVIEGIRVDASHLATDLQMKLGPSGLFTGERHTLQYVRDEHFQPKITDRLPRALWEERGSRSVIDRATATALKIMRTHQPEPLPKSMQRDLRAIIESAEKEYVRCPQKFLVPEPDRIE